MTFSPYLWRIMARLSDADTPLELYRSRKPFERNVFNNQIKHMDSCWTIWIEHTTPERQLVSPRVRIQHHTNHHERLRMSLYELAGSTDAAPLRMPYNSVFNRPTGLPSRSPQREATQPTFHQQEGAPISCNGHLDNPTQVIEQTATAVPAAQQPQQT